MDSMLLSLKSDPKCLGYTRTMTYSLISASTDCWEIEDYTSWWMEQNPHRIINNFITSSLRKQALHMLRYLSRIHTIFKIIRSLNDTDITIFETHSRVLNII